MIELKPISILDKEMAECVHLSVTEEQYNFVATNSYSLAEAYDLNKAYEESGEGNRAAPFVAYADGKMVGFAMIGYMHPNEDDGEYGIFSDEPVYYFLRLFVDKEYQGKGFGKEILRLAMEKVKAKFLGDANWCFAQYIPDNDVSRRTFAAYGFEEDGRIIYDETVCKIGI